MPRVGDVFQLLSGTLAVPNTTIQSAPYNAQQNDWVTEANSPRPISAGGTGETTASEARESLGAIGVGDLSGADTKAAVVETDSVVIIDSEDDNTNKRWLVSDLTAYMEALIPQVTGLSRNLIVNPAFQINQEHPGEVVTANGAYPADQWAIASGGMTTGVIGVSAPQAGIRYVLLGCSTTQAPLSSNSYWGLRTRIEGIRIPELRWGTLEERAAVLRLFVFSNTTPGIYSVIIRNVPNTDTFVGSFELTSAEVAAAEYVEKTIVIPPPPSGTWATNNSTGIEVFIMLAAGSSYIRTPGWGSTVGLAVAGQVNFLASSANQLAIRGVGLYIDPDNTGVAPKWEIPDEAEELRACQRYYHKIGPAGGNGVPFGAAHTPTSTLGRGHIPFSPPMRISPTVTISAASDFAISCQSTLPASALGATPTGPEMVTLEFTVAGAVSGQGGYLRSQNSNAAIYLNARL